MNYPIHRHDCRGCEFLGHVNEGQDDVYQCDHIDLIIRHGSEESENKAMPISIVREHMLGTQKWSAAYTLYERKYPLSRAL